MNDTLEPNRKDIPFHLSLSMMEKLLFWTLAVLLLVLNLGIDGLRGSEGRWADVVRLMMLNGDYLHPMINYEAYFDKPLVSYWIIAGFTALTGGEVTEFLIRLPSALAGLISLWATRLIASRFDGKTTGVFASWILLTVYSFAYWGRLGEADMLNLAFSTMAVAWYVIRRDRTDLGSYLVFGLLCAVGGQTKGLSAIAVPVLAVLADAVIARSWKKHLNWKIFAAMLVSLAVYLIPFLLAAAKTDYEDNGLALVFQENIQRYFNSLDHKQEWYAYFIHLPQLMMPWTPILLLAIISGIMNWKKNNEADRWILVCIAVIFAVFSISDSKRVYYILPILPYCALLCARFLLAETAGLLEKIRDILLAVCMWLIPVAAVFFAGCAVFGWTFGHKMHLRNFSGQAEFLHLLLPVMLLTGLILMLEWSIFRKMLPTELFPNRKTGKYFAVNAGAFIILLTAFFGIVMPHSCEQLRTEKPFFMQLGKYLKEHHIRNDQIYFFHHNYTNGSFYLKQPRKIAVLDHENEVEPEKLGTGLGQLIRQKRTGKVLIVGQMRYFRKISDPVLRREVLDQVQWIEQSGPLENPKKNGKKNAVLVLN